MYMKCKDKVQRVKGIMQQHFLSVFPTLEAGKPPSRRPLHSAVYFKLQPPSWNMPYSRGLVQPSEKASILEHAIHLYTHLSTIPSIRDFHISVAVGANKPRVRTLFDTGMVASAITVLRRRVLPRQDLHCSH